MSSTAFIVAKKAAPFLGLVPITREAAKLWGGYHVAQHRVRQCGPMLQGLGSMLLRRNHARRNAGRTFLGRPLLKRPRHERLPSPVQTDEVGQCRNKCLTDRQRPGARRSHPTRCPKAQTVDRKPLVVAPPLPASFALSVLNVWRPDFSKEAFDGSFMLHSGLAESTPVPRPCRSVGSDCGVGHL